MCVCRNTGEPLARDLLWQLSLCAGPFLEVEKGCEGAVWLFHAATLRSLETFPANSHHSALSPGGTLAFWVTYYVFSPEVFHVLSSGFKHISSQAD